MRVARQIIEFFTGHSPAKYRFYYTLSATVCALGVFGVFYMADQGTPSLLPWIPAGYGALLFVAAKEEKDAHRAQAMREHPAGGSCTRTPVESDTVPTRRTVHHGE